METTAMPGEKKLPGGINTLTILTFIGCGLGLIASVWGFFGADKNVANLEKLAADDNAPAFAKSMASPEAIERAKVMAANIMPITLISVIALVFCFIGALQMRKLKKQGYVLWLIGELLPFVGMGIFLGASSLTNMQGIIAICITLLFIILYTVQRKHLVN